MDELRNHGFKPVICTGTEQSPNQLMSSQCINVAISNGEIAVPPPSQMLRTLKPSLQSLDASSLVPAHKPIISALPEGNSSALELLVDADSEVSSISRSAI